MLLQQPPTPIIVRVIEQPIHQTSYSDVIFGSLGLVGVMLIVAALMGLLLGGGLILWKRLRRHDALDADNHAASVRVTPTS